MKIFFLYVMLIFTFLHSDTDCGCNYGTWVPVDNSSSVTSSCNIKKVLSDGYTIIDNQSCLDINNYSICNTYDKYRTSYNIIEESSPITIKIDHVFSQVDSISRKTIETLEFCDGCNEEDEDIHVPDGYNASDIEPNDGCTQNNPDIVQECSEIGGIVVDGRINCCTISVCFAPPPEQDTCSNHPIFKDIEPPNKEWSLKAENVNSSYCDNLSNGNEHRWMALDNPTIGCCYFDDNSTNPTDNNDTEDNSTNPTDNNDTETRCDGQSCGEDNPFMCIEEDTGVMINGSTYEHILYWNDCESCAEYSQRFGGRCPDDLQNITPVDCQPEYNNLILQASNIQESDCLALINENNILYRNDGQNVPSSEIVKYDYPPFLCCYFKTYSPLTNPNTDDNTTNEDNCAHDATYFDLPFKSYVSSTDACYAAAGSLNYQTQILVDCSLGNFACFYDNNNSNPTDPNTEDNNNDSNGTMENNNDNNGTVDTNSTQFGDINITFNTTNLEKKLDAINESLSSTGAISKGIGSLGRAVTDASSLNHSDLTNMNNNLGQKLDGIKGAIESKDNGSDETNDLLKSIEENQRTETAGKEEEFNSKFTEIENAVSNMTASYTEMFNSISAIINNTPTVNLSSSGSCSLSVAVYGQTPDFKQGFDLFVSYLRPILLLILNLIATYLLIIVAIKAYADLTMRIQWLVGGK